MGREMHLAIVMLWGAWTTLAAGACAQSPANTPAPEATPAATAAAPTAEPKAAATESPAPDASPAASPTADGNAEPAAPPVAGAVADGPPIPGPLDADIGVDTPLQEGWATIDEKAESADRAWLEGEIQQGDRLTITTSNVREFSLDLTRLKLNWDKRILLKMDSFNSELTRKRWPAITFVRTPSGAWVVVEK